MDDIDRQIIKALQGGFEIDEHPFASAAAPMGLSEKELIGRIDGLLSTEVLSRFGPLYNPERLDGGVALAAMSVPAERFESVAETVNGFPEMAHNYEHDQWPYLFTMVHGRSRAEVEEKVAVIAKVLGPWDQSCGVLYGRRILKRTGIRI